MSKIVAQAAIKGARKLTAEAEEFLNKAIKEKTVLILFFIPYSMEVLFLHLLSPAY